MTGPTHTAFYDDQCEICQALGTWLKHLDKTGAISLEPIEESRVRGAGLTIEECSRNLHVVDRGSGKVSRGSEAVAELARQFPSTAWLGGLASLPILRGLSSALYRVIADNRYALSKCRGGACRAARKDCESAAPLRVFWSCYAASFLMRIPLALGAYARFLGDNLREYLATRGVTIELMGGRLSLTFLNGWPFDVVPLIFGERFVFLRYGPLAVDPGAPAMRRALESSLSRPGISAVFCTHKHEEHIGNAAWLSRRLGVPLLASRATSAHIRSPRPLPLLRSLILGQPASQDAEITEVEGSFTAAGESFEVYPAPGHCDDHVVVYDRANKTLLAGDAFMGVYFSTPNPDVDSKRWVKTLERILELDIEILVEGHGHVHTLRGDFPDFPGVVIRENPKRALEEKLHFFHWLRGQIETGFAEGLPIRAVEATCFPWHRSWTWERLANDELTRVLTLGEFSRTELVRSFLRQEDRAAPMVFKASAHLKR